MTIIDQQADGIMSIHHPLLHPLFPYVFSTFWLLPFSSQQQWSNLLYTRCRDPTAFCMVTSESINEVTLRYAYYITWSSSWLTWWMLPLFHTPAQQQQPQQQKTPQKGKERGQIVCPINRFGQILSLLDVLLAISAAYLFLLLYSSYISPPEKKNQKY